jgi:mRNA-degrading endonuclease toxin of MazEF toxin-antitoxin module
VLVPAPHGSDYTGDRLAPGVVVQGDLGNEFAPNVIVCLISATVPERAYPMHVRIEAGSAAAIEGGLERTCIVKTEAIVTVPRHAVQRRLGSLPREALDQVDAGLRLSLGLSG